MPQQQQVVVSWEGSVSGRGTGLARVKADAGMRREPFRGYGSLELMFAPRFKEIVGAVQRVL
jgi:hypothetical protein